VNKLTFIFTLLLALGVTPAFAANYTVAGSCTDPTPIGADYTARYDWEIKVNAAAATAYNDLTTCAVSATVVANPTDTISVRVRNRNLQGPLIGAWTTWFTATAPTIPTPPSAITGVVITVTPQ
jgi:hypothetical protein